VEATQLGDIGGESRRCPSQNGCCKDRCATVHWASSPGFRIAFTQWFHCRLELLLLVSLLLL
jgi:hypothetical protein